VFPVNARGPKTPLIAGGHNAASADPEQIIKWWTRWPGARVGAPTGLGFVVLDVDIRVDRNGFDTLAALLGTAELPQTRFARTPSGGVHLYFEVPEPPIRNTTGASGRRGLGAGLDWRGLGGFVLLPAPGTGYEWISEEALAPVPPALMPKPVPLRVVGTPKPCAQLTPYGSAASMSALDNILRAPNGEQEITLHRECFAIGSLAGAGHVPPDLALELLLFVKDELTSYDPARPWRPGEVEAHVRRSFGAGLENPRPDWEETERALDEQLKGATDVDVE
jgi:catechol 2,3-dioxygenase-like lactoylglutathione lyase family enzyme